MFTRRLLQSLRSLPALPMAPITKPYMQVPSQYSRSLAHRTVAMSLPAIKGLDLQKKQAPKLDPVTIQNHGIISYKNNRDIKPGYFETLNPNSLPMLTRLNLSGVDIAINDLNKILIAAHQLEYLNINWNKAIQANEIAHKATTKAEHLKYFKCMETHLNGYDIQRLLLLSPKLEKVSLHFLENIKPNDFARLKITHANIHELSLFGTKVTIEDIYHIIQNFPKLKKLGLTRCSLIDPHDILEYQERFQDIQFI